MSRSKYATLAGIRAGGWFQLCSGLCALFACTSPSGKDPRVGELSAKATATGSEPTGRSGLSEGLPSLAVAQPGAAGHASQPAAAGSGGAINPDAPLSKPSQPASQPTEPAGAHAGSEFPAMPVPSTGTPDANGQAMPGPSEQGGAKPNLIDTPAGEVPVLDPDAVYVLGEDTEAQAAGLQRVYGFAALSAPDQAIIGIPIFAHVYLRRTDGQLLYDGNGITSYLYEFRRDTLPLPGASDDALTAGESVIDRAELPCGPLAAGDGLRYRVALDGSVYHTCGSTYEMSLRAANETQYEAWYDADGNRVYYGGLALNIVGANHRALFESDDGAIHVLDLANGSELATVHLAMPAIADRGFNGSASRSRSDGFWMASTSVDSNNPDATWTDLNLEGQVMGEGSYPPMPDGVTMTPNSWTERWPVLDGHGALYQFAMDGDTGVIVRRPMQDPGEVVYRSSQWSSSDPHDVLPEQLVTGI